MKPTCQSFALLSQDAASVVYSTDVDWKEMASKAALTGAIATAASFLLVGDGPASFGGISIPSSLALGLGAAGGSVVGDLAHQYVLPHIPQDQKYLGIESAAISIGAAAGGAYLASSMFGDYPAITPLVIGGASYASSDYVYHKLMNQY